MLTEREFVITGIYYNTIRIKKEVPLINIMEYNITLLVEKKMKKRWWRVYIIRNNWNNNLN